MSACDVCGLEKAEPGQDLGDDDKRCHHDTPWDVTCSDCTHFRLGYERALARATAAEERLMAVHDALHAEWERLVEGAAKVSPMHLTFVLLAGEAGLRRGELVALEQSDVGPSELTVRRNEWNGQIGLPKGGRVRRVPLTARLAEAVAAVRHLRGDRLLWQADGEPVLVTTIQSWLEVATKRAGLPASRDIHRLRHTFCSHLAMRGAPARAIQLLAGHADLATTLRYMHLSPASLDGAIRLLEPEKPARAKEGK